MIDVAIIGAGPYGLSIAAHLKPRGLNFRIFGSPMHTWLTKMPNGMHLKSEGFASSLSDPGSTFTLGRYCMEAGIPYADLGDPVPLATFSSYGLEFQKRFVPELEDKLVVSVRQAPEGYVIGLGDGEVVATRRIIVAVGLTHFEYVPPILSGLPEDYVTHSSRHHDLERFQGREVIVVGAGASALDLAALLTQAGASVQMVARADTIRFHDRGRVPRPLIDKIRHPTTGLGPSWRSLLCTSIPWAFRFLPEQFRIDFVRRHLGPAPAWFVKEQVVGRVPFHLGVNITQAKVRDGRVSLDLTDRAGVRSSLSGDHVVAATGYHVDLRRLIFLDREIQEQLKKVDQSPALSPYFQSSVPGLYFVGAAAANTFGPLMRFAFGARFTARRLSKHLATLDSRSLRVAGSEREPQREPSAAS